MSLRFFLSWLWTEGEERRHCINIRYIYKVSGESWNRLLLEKVSPMVFYMAALFLSMDGQILL